MNHTLELLTPPPEDLSNWPCEPPITSLPPELLEKIFQLLSSDLQCVRNLAEVCTLFQKIACSVRTSQSIFDYYLTPQVPVRVHIPVPQPDLSWLVKHSVPVRHLSNYEIAAFVGDQILSLNLSLLRVARLVGYDYQSRRCEVTPHYLRLVQTVLLRSRGSLRRLELNVDLSRGRRYFKFAEILTTYRGLRSLSIHFSAHIELNQRILNNDDAQNFIDLVLVNLPSLTTFNIFICPQRRLRVCSAKLRELGVYKSDGVEISGLDLPSLERLSLHESTVDLFRKILQDRETGGETMHRSLLSHIYDGCPNLRLLNNLRLPSNLCPPNRLDKREWTRQLNRALVRQYRSQARQLEGGL